MWTRLIFVVLSLALLAVGASACGGSDEDDAKSAAVDFFDAVGDGDGEQACTLMTESQRQSFEDLGGCESAFSRTGTFGPIDLPEATQVELDGDEGEVEVTASGDRTFVAQMKKEEGDWKVEDFNSP